MYAALTLEKLLKAGLDRGEVELGLVSRDNYIVFQPMLSEVISGSIGIVDTITPIRRLCPRTNLYTPRSASYSTVLGSAAAVWSVGCGVAVSTVTPSGAWNRCQWPCGTTIIIPAVIVKD